MEKRLSVILPVYNVEPYLERCIRSLMDQDIPHEEYEVIAVNDGSPDNSRAVVQKLMNEFPNLVLIDQENRGVSMARNAAIDRAVGNYVLFVDPDDHIQYGVLGRTLKNLNEEKIEVLFLGYRFLDSRGDLVREVNNTRDAGRVFDGVEAYFRARGDGKTDPDRSWGILFQQRFLDDNQLRYLSNVPYLEDGEFLARVLCKAQRCMFSGQGFYIRTTRPGSATNSALFYSDRAIQGFFRAAQNLKAFQQQVGLSARQQKFLNQPICKFVLLVLIPLCSIANWSRFWEWVGRLRLAGFAHLDLEGLQRYYYLEGFMYTRVPLLLWLHRVIRMPLFKILSNTEPRLQP